MEEERQGKTLKSQEKICGKERGKARKWEEGRERGVRERKGKVNSKEVLHWGKVKD